MHEDSSNEKIHECLGLPEQSPYASGFGVEEGQYIELERLEDTDDVDGWMKRAHALIETMPDEIFTEILEEILHED